MFRLLGIVAAFLLLVGTGASESAAHPVAPTMFSPAQGETVASFGPTLVWSNPPGATQYHLQVVPASNDGPGIDIYVAQADLLFRVPAPPAWYGLLPDMTYTWRLQVSDSPFIAAPADPSWGLWAERIFRTPAAMPTSIVPMMPVQDEHVGTLTPTVQWNDSNPEVFYYEVQLSKDPAFDTNPVTGWASVHWVLVHGGVTLPGRSYTVPAAFSLEDGTDYHWRVRPRVQGDAKSVDWSPAFRFRTETTAPVRASIGAMTVGTGPGWTACGIQGTSTSFVSTPLLTSLDFAYEFVGPGVITNNWYRDSQPVLSLPGLLPGGVGCVHRTLGAAGEPLAPGRYDFEIWHAGQKLQSISAVVTPAAGLNFGPVVVGTGMESGPGCRITGQGTVFGPASQLYVRFNTVGSGEYIVRIGKDGVFSGGAGYQAAGPAGCNVVPLSFRPDSVGSWTVAITVGAQTRQSVTFTIG